MSINKLISINNPIVDAMEMLSLENDKDKMVFTRWAYQAEKEIGSRYQFIKKKAVLDISGCSACLPNDAAYVQAAVIGDMGCDCTDLLYQFCGTVITDNSVFESPVGPTFLVVDVSGGYAGLDRNVMYELQNNKMVFYSNLDGLQVTVQYLGYKTDCDGFLEISENHVLAITAYICWKYFMRKRRPSNEDFYKIREWKAEWDREAGNARAQDSVLTDGQRANIVSILHDPLIGHAIQTVPAGLNWYWGR